MCHEPEERQADNEYFERKSSSSSAVSGRVGQWQPFPSAESCADSGNEAQKFPGGIRIVSRDLIDHLTA